MDIVLFECGCVHRVKSVLKVLDALIGDYLTSLKKQIESAL